MSVAYATQAGGAQQDKPMKVTPDHRAAGQDRRAGASAAAIASHYDLSDDFFRLVLGPEMIYSCALFHEGDALAAAQTRKLDHHIAEAGAAGATRVLDVGCGWGAMLTRLVEQARVEHAVGLTLSPSQAAWIRRDLRPGMEVREEHWRDHRPERRYGAVISVGAFEHFAHGGLGAEEKLDAYRAFFAFCDRVLVSQGRLSLQTIAYTAAPGDLDTSIFERVFPESELPLLWQPIAAADGLFELVNLRNDRADYFRTLRAWDRNLVANRDAAVALVGEAAVADFQNYLRVSAAVFQRGIACLLRMTFVKRS
jgi:cyclopropane-fatty-acyl-phospholipid synthase